MLIAAEFLMANKKIVYAPDMRVIHSHSYTLKQQFSRNFDIGVFLAQHAEMFRGISAQSEGIKMVKWVILQLLKQGRFLSIVYYVLECAAKLFGNKMGGNYKKLSDSTILRCTMNKKYWKK